MNERRSRNQEVANLLQAIGDLLEIKGEASYRVNAYRNAARTIEGMREDIATLAEQGRLREIRGVGEALEKKIAEYLDTGRLTYYENLRAEFPPGLVTLLEVPGLGPRKARIVYDRLGIENLEQLEQAARAHRLRDLPGMGEKTEENILRELERLKQRTTRHLLGDALPLAEELVATLQAGGPGRKVAYAGSARRMRATVGDLDLLVATDDPESVAAQFVRLPSVVEVVAHGPTKTTALLTGGLQADLRIVPPEAWGAALQYFTGSKEHNVRLRELAIARGLRLNEYALADAASGRRVAGEDEAGIYAALGLQYIPPELREDRGEIEAARAGRLPRLIELADLRGDLHTHTDWTDGSAPLERMARAAQAAGLSYIAVTDHTKSLSVARGLDERRVREQRQLVERLNAELAPFRIFLGTEMDIRPDGALDLPDEVLAELDYVSVSVHSAMHQPREVMTARVIRAISNPFVHALNHPRGRLLRRREEYALDLEAVIEAAARHGVALELNAQPSRLDLDGEWAARAREAGCRFTISSDAHGPGQFALLRFGVGQARRGWLEARHVLNALSADELAAYLAEKRARARVRA